MPELTLDTRRLFVLDTNVLMHDPTAIFRFAEHDIFLPMVVLEELDKAKKGMSEVARNVRQVSRFLDDIMGGTDSEHIDEGLPIPGFGIAGGNGNTEYGRLFFQTQSQINHLPDSLPGETPDNSILGAALALRDRMSPQDVVLISKDINLRIKATIVGIPAEDYNNDQVLDDVTLLYSGSYALEADFWERHSKDVESWQESGHTFYRIHGTDAPWTIGQAASSGCVRMYNNHAIDLYKRTKVGAKVVVTWRRYTTRPGYAAL